MSQENLPIVALACQCIAGAATTPDAVASFARAGGGGVGERWFSEEWSGRMVLFLKVFCSFLAWCWGIWGTIFLPCVFLIRLCSFGCWIYEATWKMSGCLEAWVLRCQNCCIAPDSRPWGVLDEVLNVMDSHKTHGGQANDCFDVKTLIAETLGGRPFVRALSPDDFACPPKTSQLPHLSEKLAESKDSCQPKDLQAQAKQQAYQQRPIAILTQP